MASNANSEIGFDHLASVRTSETREKRPCALPLVQPGQLRQVDERVPFGHLTAERNATGTRDPDLIAGERRLWRVARELTVPAVRGDEGLEVVLLLSHPLVSRGPRCSGRGWRFSRARCGRIRSHCKIGEGPPCRAISLLAPLLNPKF